MSVVRWRLGLAAEAVAARLCGDFVSPSVVALLGREETFMSVWLLEPVEDLLDETLGEEEVEWSTEDRELLESDRGRGMVVCGGVFFVTEILENGETESVWVTVVRIVSFETSG